MKFDRSAPDIDTDSAVRERYSAAALTTEAALCCPVDYDPQHLALIPQEVLERVGDARVVAVTGLPLAGKTLVARDLERLASAAGRDLVVLDDQHGQGQEVDTRARVDARIRVEASEDALVLRARGQRAGTAPIERLLEESLPRARAAAANEPAPTVTIDATNPIALVLR